MTEAPPPAPVESIEPVKPPERELFNSHFRALHGRILIGKNTLNPDIKNIPDVTKEALTNGSPQVLNECATNCRRKVALVEKDKLETEIASSVAKNTLVLKQDLSGIKGFNTEKANRWRTTLTKLFGKDTSTATEVEVRALFDKYFYSKDRLGNASDTDLFAEDVLRVFNNDLSEIEKNIDCINWYARICGFTQDFSEIVFKHQITAKVLLKANPDQLVVELNQKTIEDNLTRINDSNSDEDEVLRFIWGNRGKVMVTFTPPTETTTSSQTEEEKRLTAKKANYEQSRDQLDQLITNPKTELEQINLGRKNIGLAEIKKEDLAGLRTDEKKRKKFIIETILGQHKKILVADQVIDQLPEEEKQALEYAGLQQVLAQNKQALSSPKPQDMSDTDFQTAKSDVQKEIDEIEKAIALLPKELLEKIQKGEIKPAELQTQLQEKIHTLMIAPQPEIVARIAALRNQIYQWEGMMEEETTDSQQAGPAQSLQQS